MSGDFIWQSGPWHVEQQRLSTHRKAWLARMLAGLHSNGKDGQPASSIPGKEIATHQLGFMHKH